MSSMWTVPLYLFASKQNQDSVLLHEAPQTAFGSDYSLVYSEPLSFAQKFSTTPVFPLVSLKAYWSAERRDLQTSTWSLAELNAHGGNYEFVSNVGLIAANLTGGVESAAFVPLITSYDETHTDAVTSPFSFADLNLLSPLTDALGGTASFRQGHLTGFGAKATCGEYCSVGMSETFPSAGGADCYYECASGQKCYAYGYRVGEVASPEAYSFDAAMRRAGEILKSFGDIDDLR